MSIHLAMSILFCIFVGEMRGIAHPPMTGAQTNYLEFMNYQKFKMVFVLLDGTKEIVYAEYATRTGACVMAIERIIADSRKAGVIVLQEHDGFYTMLMDFNISGIYANHQD